MSTKPDHRAAKARAYRLLECEGMAPEALNSARAYLDLTEQLATKDAVIGELVEALEFYADKNNWDNEDNSNFKIQIVDDYQEFRPNRKAEYFGGKRARETLARIRGLE